MDINCVIKYIKQGQTIKNANGQMLFALGNCVITIIGLIVGAIAGSISATISYFMLALALVSVVLVFPIAEDESHFRKFLSMAINSINTMLQMILLLTMVYLLVFGLNIYIISIYVLIILIPLIKGIRNTKKLKNNICLTSKKPAKAHGILSFSATISFSSLLGALISDVKQEVLHIVLFAILLFICCVFSVGFLNVHRLYIYAKYKKQGLITEELMKQEIAD